MPEAFSSKSIPQIKGQNETQDTNMKLPVGLETKNWSDETFPKFVGCPKRLAS